MSSFTFTVNVETAFGGSGLLESRDSLAQAILDALESADPGTIQGDNGTDYEIVGWDVSETD